MRCKKSFTLIELLVVLVILGFFAAMMTKVFTSGDDQRRFDETRIRMEEIKKAILGNKGAYANGQRQFAGYVADMGSLPELVKDDGTIDEKGEGQPKGLWIRDLNDNGDTLDATDIPESLVWEHKGDEPSGVIDGGNNYRCIRTHIADDNNRPTGINGTEYWLRDEIIVVGAWGLGDKYYSGIKIWIGWRGPYLETPPGNILKDGWGNVFFFTRGDLVNGTDNNTYRCKFSHTASNADKPTTGGSYGTYWEKVADGKFGGIWVNNKEYSFEPLNITSFGADGIMEGSEFNEDITLTIRPTEYAGSLGGRIIDSTSSPVSGAMARINFFYKGDDAYCWVKTDAQGYFHVEKDYALDNSINNVYCSPSSLEDSGKFIQDIPVGLIKIFSWDDDGDDVIAAGEEMGDIIFTLEPTGNWLGDIEIQ